MARFAHSSVLAVALTSAAFFCGMVPSAQAAITRYTDRAAFEAALSPGAYIEDQMFTQYSFGYSGGPGFSYTVSASGGPFAIGSDLSTNNTLPPSELLFNFDPGIRGFGGYFYVTDETLALASDSFTVSLNGGSFTFIESSSSATTFYGYLSDSDLADATIAVNTADRFVTAGSVIVGTVPGPLPVLGASAAFGWSRRLRRRLAAGRPGA
jgi:hypothetical protein